jgi:hypothetical protein
MKDVGKVANVVRGWVARCEIRQSKFAREPRREEPTCEGNLWDPRGMQGSGRVELETKLGEVRMSGPDTD